MRELLGGWRQSPHSHRCGPDLTAGCRLLRSYEIIRCFAKETVAAPAFCFDHKKPSGPSGASISVGNSLTSPLSNQSIATLWGEWPDTFQLEAFLWSIPEYACRSDNGIRSANRTVPILLQISDEQSSRHDLAATSFPRVPAYSDFHALPEDVYGHQRR